MLKTPRSSRCPCTSTKAQRGRSHRACTAMQAKEAQACNKPARNGRRVTTQAENVVQAIKEVVSNADAPNKTMICTSVAGATVAEALETIKTANQSGADLLELRLDFYEDFAAERHLKQLLDACAVPRIVTYRPSWEGGKYGGEEAPRLAVLRQAAAAGAEYIDVELDAVGSFNLDKEPLPEGTKLILSHHNFERTLDKVELLQLERRMRGAGADVAKLAMTANDICDSRVMLDLLSEATEPLIALSMGERGVITRILAAKHGAFLTFGALAAGQESAPGQPTVEDLRGLYRIHQHSRDTKVFGIIGNPVKHSRSPALHNRAMAQGGVDAVYVPLLVDDMATFMETFREQDWAGFSVTIPHKEAACRLGKPEPVAANIGAVNTLVRNSDGSMAGHNTDWKAALDAIEEELRKQLQKANPKNKPEDAPLRGDTAVVLGTGGAARALAFGAAERGALVVVIGRSFSKAAPIAAALKKSEGVASVAASYAKLEDGVTVPEIDVIINTTPLGMVGENEDKMAVSRELLEMHKPLVFDAVYTPLETKLLREAASVGCRTVNGLDMFVGQAAEQYRLFTGLEAPVELMEATVLESLGQ